MFFLNRSRLASKSIPSSLLIQSACLTRSMEMDHIYEGLYATWKHGRVITCLKRFDMADTVRAEDGRKRRARETESERASREQEDRRGRRRLRERRARFIPLFGMEKKLQLCKKTLFNTSRTFAKSWALIHSPRARPPRIVRFTWRYVGVASTHYSSTVLHYLI